MKSKIRIIGVSLASMAGILLVSGVAWAQAEETPITVRIGSCEDLEEPERREWVDEDGIVHVRDNMFRCWTRRDMVGTITGWASWDTDPAAGHHFAHGYLAFAGSVLGGELTGAVGRFTVEANRIEGVWTYNQEDVMHLDGGGLVLLSGTWRSGQRRILHGIVLDTPGGEKRQGPRPRR
jgi:hypothetical protein